MTYRVIAVSNFDLDYVADKLIEDDINDLDAAEEIADKLNAEYSGPTSYYFHKVVDEHYVLHTVEDW